VLFTAFNLLKAGHVQASPFHPQNCPLPRGHLHPDAKHGSLDPPDSVFKMHFNLFSHFCTAHYKINTGALKQSIKTQKLEISGVGVAYDKEQKCRNSIPCIML